MENNVIFGVLDKKGAKNRCKNVFIVSASAVNYRHE